MTREQSIPLFLWVAAALVVHAATGGGAGEVSDVLGERMDIESFAREVRKKARLEGSPLEVSFDADEIEIEEEEKPAEAEPTTEPEKPPEVVDEDTLPEAEKPKKEEKKPDEKKVEQKKEEKKVPDLLEKPPEPPPPTPTPQGRVAVRQHVLDENQKDNPNARHAADHANHVEEETRARITSTDQDSEQPSPGGNFAGSEKQPGNSEEHRVASSEEAPGEKGHAPGKAEAPPEPPTPTSSSRAETARAPTPALPATPVEKAAPATPPPPGGQKAQPAVDSRAETPERAAVAETHTAPDGSFGVPKPRAATPAQAARKKLPPRKGSGVTDLLGLGKAGLTPNGVNLSLTPQMAMAAIGADRLAAERKGVGERRLARHRGSWQSLGLERWRPAIENYVATVKPGNQTALNTARVPFASYLNEIHNRIHPVFADHFLAHLSALPASHPMNNQEMSTHLEIQLSGQDGRVMRLGITKTSGVTGFDVGALDSVERAGPYGAPPPAILSSDGNVYLHWEFHRRPELACSTYFARPYLLKLPPSTAPPRVDPPPPDYRDGQKDEKSGSLEAPSKAREARHSAPARQSGKTSDRGAATPHSR